MGKRGEDKIRKSYLYAYLWTVWVESNCRIFEAKKRTISYVFDLYTFGRNIVNSFDKIIEFFDSL